MFLWLFGFPSPVVEFFLVGVVIFFSGATYLALNIEDVPGVESLGLRERQRKTSSTPSED